MAIDGAQYILCLNKIIHSFLVQVETRGCNCHFRESLPVHHVCVQNAPVPCYGICPIGEGSLVEKRIVT